MSRRATDIFRTGLVADVQRIRGLLSEDKNQEAFEAAKGALAKVAAQGGRSGQVLWLAAVSADYAGYAVEALGRWRDERGRGRSRSNRRRPRRLQGGRRRFAAAPGGAGWLSRRWWGAEPEKGVVS